MKREHYEMLLFYDMIRSVKNANMQRMKAV